MRRALLPITVLLLLPGCSAFRGATAPESPPEVSATPATVEMPRAVHWTRNSAEHRAIFLQTYRMAEWVLEAQAADLKVGTWAVAVDADETIIDNSLYEKEIAALGQSMTEDTWDDWVKRREATALPGAVAFLERVHALGGRVAVVTNRRLRHCEATEDVLRTAGIPFDVVLCRGEDGEKEPRWETVELGNAAPGLPPLRIVMWLGDNIGDFPDLDQTVRFHGDAAFADFGTRFIVFPNPGYGSWEENPQD